MDSKHKKPASHHGPLTHAEKEKITNRWVTIGFAITAVIIVLLIGYGILNEAVFNEVILVICTTVSGIIP